jgi:hypothetical protein
VVEIFATYQPFSLFLEVLPTDFRLYLELETVWQQGFIL